MSEGLDSKGSLVTHTAIMWFRRDLRLGDNAALDAAVRESEAVVPVFVLGDEQEPPTATDAWLNASLGALHADLTKRESGLVLAGGSSPAALSVLAREYSASRVHCTREWTPEGLDEERLVRDALSANGAELVVHEGSLLATPDMISTQTGTPYRVFTPYYRSWQLTLTAKKPLSAPECIPRPTAFKDSLTEIGVDKETQAFRYAGNPGERGGRRRLEEFIGGAIREYDSGRDLPAIDGTSRLSPHLAWGEVSPLQIAWAVQVDAELPGGEAFMRQIAWRDFAYHVLHAFPDLATLPLRKEFTVFPWSDDDAALDIWREGRTGFPLVDAGMRQLAATGWMHNRVRLVVASFLVKDLLIPWQLGEAHFEKTLTDLDTAANAFNWQWVAGSGADAAPYFRVFNPVTQARRFDPDGAYVREWIPELGSSAYPEPMVDHTDARLRALAAYAATRSR